MHYNDPRTSLAPKAWAAASRCDLLTTGEINKHLSVGTGTYGMC